MTTPEEMIARYKQAEKIMKARKLVSKTGTVYTWNKNETKMIYKHDLYDNQKEYTFVDILEGKQKVVFDHSIILEEINKHLEEKAEVLDLTITELTDDDNIIVTINDFRFEISLNNEVEKLENLPTKEEPADGTSPDGKLLTFVKNYNMFLQDLKSKEEFQLTFDGEKGISYGVGLTNVKDMIEQGSSEPKQDLDILWSPDSKYFLTQKIDYRDCDTMPVIQSSPPDGGKPKLFNPVYPCAGDEKVPLNYVYLVDIANKTCTIVDNEPIEIYCFGSRLWLWSNLWFSKNNDKFYYVIESRGMLTLQLKEIDLASCSTRLIFEKKSDRKLINYFKPILSINKTLNICDSDGWPHLYLYDLKTGEMEQQITSGEFGVKEIEHIDEEKNIIYFTAYGKEDCNPYYEMLYRVNFDGSDLQLLTPEKQFHQIKFSPSFKYFIDTYSTVTDPEKYLLRKSLTGEKILKLNELDITRLVETGWTPVEEFVAKARDGKTDIYCNIHRPSNFDPNKIYPVIESIYAGPFCYAVPKYFMEALCDYLRQIIAELGFIVVMIDGFGTLGRGNEFQDYSYKKVQDSGLPDHIAALKQIAKKYPYMDLDRVGLYGHSLGGYDTVNAMLRYPQFYKVGVATAGVHDFTMDKASYVEEYVGYPVGVYYEQSSNIARAEKLEGKLLLAHGEVDDNCHPANTMRLVKALIDYNKDFDMMIMPNEDHGVLGNSYFQRKMWDYFVTHLLGETPPREYKIGE